MSKHVSSVLAAVILTLALSALAFAQETTTTVTKTVQNPDGTYTVIEYPVKKEITLNLTPVSIQKAKGVATILRDDDGTRIKLNLTDVPADVTALTLYAVDDTGAITALGPSSDQQRRRHVCGDYAAEQVHVGCVAGSGFDCL
jgi:GH15 family glucan-1,4-alpha-glucosidase